jgi:acyl transferase domain-containing protein
VTDIGCYLGVGAVDYEDNVASEDANAFSATGTLRAFISGRISHYFGWSGPSITFDTGRLTFPQQIFLLSVDF